MTTTRLQHLQQLAATIGEKQLEYHAFFPQFGEKLVLELGKYLGQPSEVALCNNDTEFRFEKIYRHEGIGFEEGRYRIPIMIRIKNLLDQGCLVLRIRIYCTKSGSKLEVQIEKYEIVKFEETNLSVLVEALYKHFCSALSTQTWFANNQIDYQGTGMGFTASN